MHTNAFGRYDCWVCGWPFAEAKPLINPYGYTSSSIFLTKFGLLDKYQQYENKYSNEDKNNYAEAQESYFSLPSNKISLCEYCSDGMYDPLESGLYIIPSDLDYFIQFELEDQRRRKTAPPTTNPKPGRIVPDAETYYLHQRNQGALSSDDRWGLYDLVYYEQKRKIKHIRRKASWSGQPVFAIWRALGILASPHIAKVPRGVVEKLEMLRELYFSDDDDDDDEGDGDGDGGGREDMLDGEKWEFEGEVEALDLDLDIGSPEYCPSPSPAVQNEGDVDSQTTESLFQWGSKLATIQEEPSMPDQGWFL